MTEDELKAECGFLVAAIACCIDNHGELYDPVRAVDSVKAFAKRMQAVGFRDAADVANAMASYEVRNWCLFQAKEREG